MKTTVAAQQAATDPPGPPAGPGKLQEFCRTRRTGSGGWAALVLWLLALGLGGCGGPSQQVLTAQALSQIKPQHPNQDLQQQLLLDFPAAGQELEDCRRRIEEFAPGLVVCDTATPSIESDVASLVAIKSWFPSPPLGVLVGPHVSALPAATLALSPALDVVARGEYDWTLCQLAGAPARLAEVAGISFRQAGRLVHNPDRPYAEDPDELPFVSRVYKKHLNIRHYFYAHCRNPVISIFAGRGCPNHCFYCVYPQVMFGRRYGHRSAAHVVAELEYIAREFPEVREVLIDDDNFTADQDFVAQICDDIIRRGLAVTWTCEARVNLRYEIMVQMKRAGCRLLVAGFESGDQQVLRNIRKGITLAQAEEFSRNARRAGLRVHGCFMAGNRGEDRRTLRRTLDFALRLPLDTAQFFPLMVYPGTEAYHWAQENGHLRAESFRQWLTPEGMHNCVLETDALGPRDLVDFCDYARRRFYLRPRYLAYKAADLWRHPGETRRTVKAAATLATHLFRRH
jgi:anaerobic magnesium-protoporphyrin IX monomethyl ester cyclase